MPLPDLKYAQVIKHKENDEVKTIETKVVFGDEEEVFNKLEIVDDKRRWKQRTPAIAANITDHIWTLEELCKFKPPPVY